MPSSLEPQEHIELAETDLLLGLLRSADPAMRDDFAYTALADLVASKATEPGVVSHIVDACREALSVPLGRSYSCLVLNAVLEADLSQPMLSAGQWEAITGAIVRWWQAEPDERGYDPALGWVHCLAHGADTLLLACQSRHADPAFRADCLTIISRKLASTTRIFEGYEDVRCALAFSAAVFGGCGDDALALVSDVVRPVLSAAPGTPRWAAKVNLTSFLERLHLLWTVGISPYPAGFDHSVFAAPGVADGASLAWLTELLERSDDFGVLVKTSRPG
jgi:hypothetical protein